MIAWSIYVVDDEESIRQGIEDALGDRYAVKVFPNAEGAVLGEKYKLAMETRTFQSYESAYKDERFDAWYDIRIYPAQTGLSVLPGYYREEDGATAERDACRDLQGDQ